MPTLKARIGGTWVDVGGSSGASEVEIGTSDPIGTNASAELWYDTDAVTPLADDLRWFTAWGVAGSTMAGTTFSTIAPHTTPQTTGLSVSVTEVAGRRMAIRTQLCLYPNGGLQPINAAVWRNGVALESWFVPAEAMAVGASFPLAHTTLYNTVASGAATYTVYLSGASVNTAVSDFQGRAIVAEDVGPVTGTAIIPSVPVTAWTALPMSGTWSSYDGGVSFNNPSYRMVGDVVYLRGLVKSTGSDLNVGTLPVGFRPLKTAIFLPSAQISGGNVAARVDASWTGIVSVVTTTPVVTITSFNYLSLEGIQFSVTA